MKRPLPPHTQNRPDPRPPSGCIRVVALCLWGLCLLTLCLEAVASAAPAGASSRSRGKRAPTVDEDIERAQLEAPPPDAPIAQLLAYARQLFARQDYATAGETLERAYSREPRPIYLFNAGQSYRKAERYPESTRCYERFVNIAPTHPLAAEARDHLSTLRVLQEQQEKRREIELAIEQTQQQLDREKRTPIYKRPWFWVAIGGTVVGAVALGLGLQFYRDQRASNTGTLALEF